MQNHTAMHDPRGNCQRSLVRCELHLLNITHHQLAQTQNANNIRTSNTKQLHLPKNRIPDTHNEPSPTAKRNKCHAQAQNLSMQTQRPQPESCGSMQQIELQAPRKTTKSSNHYKQTSRQTLTSGPSIPAIKQQLIKRNSTNAEREQNNARHPLKQKTFQLATRKNTNAKGNST